MRTSKFTPEQMVHILRQGESGLPIAELCRRHQISEQTYYPCGLPPRPQERDRTWRWSACVPVSGVMNQIQRADGKSARTGLDRGRLGQAELGLVQ